MSKRGALVQGSKETGLDPDMDGTPSDSPQRATAAQMASRKIRDVRRRPRPASASGSAGAPSFGPFSAIDSNAVSSTPGPQPSAQFSFGQSQSFPGANSTPNQTNQNAPAPFAFGTGSGVPSSSFEFNAPGSSATIGNPFANLNNGLSSQPPSSNGFGGFQGSIFNLPPSENRTSSPQPPGTGLFGSQQPNSTGGLFGGFGSSNTATAPPSQPTQATGAITSNIFGQPGTTTTTTTTPSTGIFSPSTPVKAPAFGQSTGFGGDTMQTSPDTNNNKSGNSVFQNSANFGGGGGTSLFGAGSKPEEEKSPFSTPAKPLFGAKPAESSTPPTPLLFGASNSAAESAPTTTTALAPSAPAATSSATPTTTSSLFGNQSPATTTAPTQSPFQTSNLFAGTPKNSEEKDAGEKPGEVPAALKTGFQFAPSAPSSPSLFSASASAAPAATSGGGGLFGAKPTFGTPQPTSSTGNMFAPKPAAPAGQEKSEPAPSNPFGSLFTSPATKPASTNKLSEEKPQPAQNPFANIFTPKPSLSAEGPKTTESQNRTTGPSLFSTSTPKPSGIFSSQPSAEKPSIFSAPAESKTQPSAPSPVSHTEPTVKPKEEEPVTAAPTTAKVGGAKPVVPSDPLAQPPTAKPSRAPARFQELRPRNIPSSLEKSLKDDVDLLWRVRTLNECFKRRIADLDPSKDDFDALVLYYMRVRETIGAPTGLGMRKMREEESATNAAVDGDAPVSKNPKSSEVSASVQQISAKDDTPGKNGAAPTSPASDMTITQSSITSTPSKLFGTPSQDTLGGNKRKSSEDEGEPAAASSGTPLGKRVKELDESKSTTASIFARSFSNSVTSENGNEAPNGDSSKTQTSSAFESSVSDPSKPVSGSTTPTSSPSKPSFSFSFAPKESPASSSLFSPSASISKPAFGAPASNGSTEPPNNPFVLKRTEGKDTDSSSKTSITPPKFGTGNATNFFSQFQKQADENAAKEKAKRKAEDYDSEEEDESEWERKDAEAQRKKREEIESLSKNRPKFIPGKGFSFDESPETSAESKETEQASSVNESTSSAGTSIFDSKSASSFKSNNIFGHLSGTPSEAGENDDAEDTEEASGDEGMDEPKNSFAPVVNGHNNHDATDSETPENGNGINKGSSNFTEKESEQKTASDKASNATTAQAPSGGRSLFDRIQQNSDENLKRLGDASPSNEKAASKPFSGLFGNSNFSFNNRGSSSNIFAQNGGSSSATTSAAGSSNIFGSSGGKTGGLFGSPAPTPTLGSSAASSGAASKPAGDNTWKADSPIKFGSGPTSASGTESIKPESGSAPTTANQSKPFSALFGGSSAGTKPSTGAPQQPLFGFGFGGPSQQGQSSLAPSTAASNTPSDSTTPGLTSDTGAEETAQDEAEDSLPQLDLAHSKAGEENEDLVMETRARALKFESGSWDSKGVGILRILKDPTKPRSRVIVRGDPSGKVILNAAIKKEIPYSASGNNVQFFVPQPGGGLEKWAVRVKKEEAEGLVSAIEECRKT